MENKYTRDEFSVANYNNNQVYYVKISTKDRNTKLFPDPFNFNVKFDGSENSKDNFGNSGLTIQSKFSSIKSIDVANLILPRYLWEENVFMTIKLSNYNFYSPGIFVVDSVLKLNNINLQLSSDDIIMINNINYSLFKQINFAKTELLLQTYPENIINSPLVLKKIRLSGKVYTDETTNMIYGIETNFDYLSVGDKILVWNTQFTINQIISKTKLSVNESVNFINNDLDIYLIDKLTTHIVSAKEFDMNKIISVSPLNLNFKWNSGAFSNRTTTIKTLVNGDILLYNNEIIIFDSVDSSNRIKIKNSLGKPVYSNTIEILDNQSSVLIDSTGEKFNFVNNVLSSSFIDFKNYTPKTIFQLKDVAGKSTYFHLTKLININQVSTTELYTESGFGTPEILVIFPASYARTKDIGAYPYINIVIDELYKSDLVGTNDLLDRSFSITNSGYNEQLNKFLYLHSHCNKSFALENLHNVKKLTFKFYNPHGELITMNNLLDSCSESNERHILHPDNQVFILLRIVGVSHQFN